MAPASPTVAWKEYLTTTQWAMAPHRSTRSPLVKWTGRRMAVQLALVMPIWKTSSWRKAVTTCPKPNRTAETLSSNLEVLKLMTVER